MSANSPKKVIKGHQLWCVNVSRKTGISFNVSHVNIFIVSHSFVLHDAVEVGWGHLLDIETL